MVSIFCNKWKIIDQASSSIKLLTLEALHIMKERPGINTRDDLRRGAYTKALVQNRKILTKTKNFEITYMLA